MYLNQIINSPLFRYFQKSRVPGDHTVILQISVLRHFSPISLARIMLTEIYKKKHSKNEIAEMLKNPNLIPDPILACNVSTCLFNDNLDGSITDSIRRYKGEEYEVLVSVNLL